MKKETMGLVKKAMEDAGLEKNQIDEIVLVGRSIQAFPSNRLETVASTVCDQWRRLGKRNMSISLVEAQRRQQWL